MSEIVKEYPADGLDIIWKPEKCIHSEVCWRTLPQVYRPKEKPWIQPAGASKEQLVAQIDRCPSGALSYRLHGDKPQSAGPGGEAGSVARIEVINNGPLRVHGPVEVTYDGQTERVDRPIVSFCRCGASEKKPYCDGTHKKIGFVDPAAPTGS